MLLRPLAPLAVRSKHLPGWLFILSILALYALLIVPTLGRLGIGWDEEVDLRVAQGYLSPRGFFFGLPLDQSQTRLPTFSVALVYRLLSVSDLLTARWTSMLVGGLALLGTFVYGWTQFGPSVSVLAVGLLALNPFFLSFSRLAFTESDIYLACTLVWLMVAVSRLQSTPTIGHAAAAAVLLGMALSAKATVVVILPGVWLALYLARGATVTPHQQSTEVPANALASRLGWFWAGWSASMLLVGVYGAQVLRVWGATDTLRLLHYGLVVLGWGLPISWTVRWRNQPSNTGPLTALMTSLGVLTFVIFPPDHLLNPGILSGLVSRAETEMALNPAFMGELAALHLLTLVFKSTPAWGLGLLLGSFASVVQWRRPELRLPLLVAASYFVGLLFLPLGQTFYTVPLLPPLSLLAANEFVRLVSQRRRFALLLAAGAIGWWGVEMFQCYPDYHLNGYQWLGQRVLFGRSSIGYRSVVFTPSDGVQQVVQWLNSNAEPDEIALMYVASWDIVRYAAPKPTYQLINGLETAPLSEPDYVAIHINELLGQGHGTDTPVGEVSRYPFARERLLRDYEPVFVVQRAFGLQVASVWKRK